MAKKIKTLIKLNIPAGSATPAPPVGPALGQHGLPIMEFVKAFNEKTADQKGTILPAVITVYEDRTFSFIVKKPPVAELIKKAFTNSIIGSPCCPKAGPTGEQVLQIQLEY